VRYVHIYCTFIKPTRNAPSSIHQAKQRDLVYGRRCIKCWLMEAKQRLLALSCLSVRPPACTNSDPTERIFKKFDILSIFQKPVEKTQFSLKYDKIPGTSRGNRLHFLIISRSVLLKVRNVSDKTCRENQNIQFMFIFFPENRSVYEIIWENIVEQDRPQMTIWRMRIAFWITKATNTVSESLLLAD